MRNNTSTLAAVLTVAMLGAGCGKLTVRTWIKAIAEQSSGSVTLLGGTPLPLSRLAGGFLGDVVMDTSTLPAPIDGTVAIENVRLAAAEPSALGFLCVWQDSSKASSGTSTIDLLAGTGSGTLDMNLLATTVINETLNVPPAGLSQSTSFSLTNVNLTSFLNAANTGLSDGLFATSTGFEGTSSIAGIPVTFNLDLKVTNDGAPPMFDADEATFCDKYFDQQGPSIFYAVNSKGSYLRATGLDKPAAPLIIRLADIGAAPGVSLRVTRVGTFADTLQLKDGTLTAVTAVFSSSNVVGSASQRQRVPGAIAAGGPRVFTGFFSDILQDFSVDPGATVTVPARAAYLIVAPLPPSRTWSDNSGFGLGVNVAVVSP
jgi:hypothetical protein